MGLPAKGKLIAAATLALLAPAILQAEFRTWKSADGSKRIKAELVGQADGKVKLQRSDGKVFLFEKSLLSRDDQDHLDELIAKETREKHLENCRFLGAFHKLQFGNNPDQVAAVMKGTPGIEGGVNEFFKNRMGMNGIFFTKVDGMRYDFFFVFNDNDRLVEMSIRSSPFAGGRIGGEMQASWRKLREALNAILGPAAMTSELPHPDKLEENMAQSTDIWDKHGRGYYLGVGRADGGMTIVVRSRRESYLKDAVPVGAPAKPRNQSGNPDVIDL